MRVWRDTHTGEFVPMVDINNPHLINCIKLLLREAACNKFNLFRIAPEVTLPLYINSPPFWMYGNVNMIREVYAEMQYRGMEWDLDEYMEFLEYSMFYQLALAEYNFVKNRYSSLFAETKEERALELSYPGKWEIKSAD